MLGGKMVATALLWRAGGETSCAVAPIQAAEWGPSGSSPLSSRTPPCLALQRIDRPSRASLRRDSPTRDPRCRADGADDPGPIGDLGRGGPCAQAAVGSPCGR